MQRTIWILILLLLPLFQNCGKFSMQERDQAENPTLQTLTNLDGRIAQNLKLNCTVASECIVAPAGHRPCGGPSRYYIFSSTATDVTLVNRLIYEFTELERDYNQSSEIVGTCEMIEPPLVDCVVNICTRQ